VCNIMSDNIITKFSLFHFLGSFDLFDAANWIAAMSDQIGQLV